jgi:hypothetical protein
LEIQTLRPYLLWEDILRHRPNRRFLQQYLDYLHALHLKQEY